jgi:hypothetical protein
MPRITDSTERNQYLDQILEYNFLSEMFDLIIEFDGDCLKISISCEQIFRSVKSQR